MEARETLLDMLRQHALVVEKVMLTSGVTAGYYIDAKRTLMMPEGFRACGELVAGRASELGATAVGGLTMGADPVAASALCATDRPLKAFSVRKVRKEHGLQRWIEGPILDGDDRCLVVEDVVTTGTSTLRAIERLRQERLNIVGALCVVDRLAGGGEAIASAVVPAPFKALFTIDDIYPERTDRSS